MNKFSKFNSKTLNNLHFGREPYNKNPPSHHILKYEFIHKTLRLRLVEDSYYEHDFIEIFSYADERWYRYFEGTDKEVKGVWNDFFEYRDAIE